MVKKVFEKAGLIPGIALGGKGPQPTSAASDASKARTAPGTMLGFMAVRSSAIQEAGQLKERVRELEGASPLRKLDPAKVRGSKWANRHQASFGTKEFQELKAEIAAAGGNVQPIKVRPVAVLNGSTPTGGEEFELVFGHRRHRACLELGLPVLALVEEADDVSLFEQMERENRGRKNLSAWEQGTMYRKALDEGLYPSLRRLAERIGIDVSQVSKSVSLARLPEAVVAAFATPLEIQYRWATPLTEALQRDPEGIVAKARELGALPKKPPAAAVFSALASSGGKVLNGSTPGSLEIKKAGKKAATLTTDAKGRALVRFEAGTLPESRQRALAKMIEEFLQAKS